jgi:rSAM/selenodomain-associated transferase 2
MAGRISIIIPVLNEAACIGPQIAYLQQQGGDAVADIIVVDGGSTDATVAIAQAAGALVLHHPVQSRAAQMNCGARAAQGALLYFVHADTKPPEHFAADIVQALERENQLIGCYRYYFDSPRLLLKINAYFNRFHWLSCQGGDKTLFIRAADFAALGGYDEQYVIMEEYDFLRRALQRGFHLTVLPAYAVVSARKYEHNSWLRVQVANFAVFNLWKWGVEPTRLRILYRQMLRKSMS